VLKSVTRTDVQIIVAHQQALLRPLASQIVHVEVGNVTLEAASPSLSPVEAVASSSASQRTLIASASSRSQSLKLVSPPPPHRLMTEEKRERGMVKSAVYFRCA